MIFARVMRAGPLFFLLLLSISAFAWQRQRTVVVDSIPSKKDIVPFTIKLPNIQLPLPHKDTFAAPTTKNLLAFPFVVHSLETNWGFGGIAARFFKPGKRDTTIRTSDANVIGLYTLRQQLILVFNSTI